MAAGLLLVTAVGLERLANLLAVGDAGGAELDLDAELALELAAQHVQVDVAGAGDDHLLGLGVVRDGEGAVLLAEAGEALGDLVLLALRLRGDGHGVARGGELNAGRGLDGLRVAEGVRGLGVGELAHRADVAAAELLDLDVLLALHIVDVAELLLGAAAGVREGHVGRDLAGDDLEEAELAELVAEGLVDDGAGGAVLIDGLAALARGGEEVLDGVEQLEGAEAGGGRAAEDGDYLALGDAAGQGAVYLVAGELHGLEVLLHELLAGAGGVLGYLVVELLDAVGHGIGDGALAALVAVVLIGLAPDDVDYAGALAALDYGSRHGAEARAELLAQGGEGSEVVRVLLVDLGDVDGLRQIGVRQGLPGLLRADVDAVLGGDADDADVRDAQGLDNLAREVEVTRGVEDVYLRLLVLRVHGGGGDAYLAADLLGVEVGDAVARGGAAHAVGDAGQEEDALGERALAVPAVAQEGDVADVFRCIAHVLVPLLLIFKSWQFTKKSGNLLYNTLGGLAIAKCAGPSASAPNARLRVGQ